MVNLTNAAISKFAYQGDASKTAWDVRWDDDIPGFGVRIYPSGKKAFVLSYRFRGRKRLMVFGRFGADLTLVQARDRARKYRVDIIDGLDPLEEKRRAGRGKTFGELIEDYKTRHVEAQKLKTGDAIMRRIKRNVPASWKSRHADAITAAEVEALHQRIGKEHPYEANRLLEILRSMYRQAPRWGYMATDKLNPTDGIKKFREKKRKRWVTPEELPPLAKAIDGEPNIYVRAALWLYLLTGLRKGELLNAKWTDVDWTRGQLRLVDTKADEEQFATLSAPALAILQSIPKMEGNPHILPGAKPERPLVNIDKAWGRIRRAAGVDDVRLHDLRRTVGSWMTQAGADLNLVKNALRHANISTTLIYARLGEDAAREAMEDHGRRILEAAGRRGPKEVINGDTPA